MYAPFKLYKTYNQNMKGYKTNSKIRSAYTTATDHPMIVSLFNSHCC